MTETTENQYLGIEKIPKLMLKFSIPCVLSLLVSALYNIVDQIFIGNSELGTLGNAATGVVFPIFIVSQAFAWCLGDGCAADLNIRQGRNDAASAHKTIGSGITVTLLASLVLLAVFFPVKKPMLTLFGASENSMPYASTYFDIVLAFFPAYMLMNMINSVIRADGSPAWAMISTISGAAVNIVLDGIFIFVCKWGMAGAAWATVIGQVISLILCAGYLAFGTKTFKLNFKSFLPDFKALAGALKLGMSSFITQMTIVVIAVVCNIMLAKYGASSEYGADIPIAIVAIESKVFTVVISLVVGIALGCQPVIGYNIGAKNMDRVKKTYLYILLCTTVIGVLFTILFEAAPRALVGIFGSPDPEQGIDPELYNEFAVKLFRIFLMGIIFTLIVKMSSIFFQAAGKPVFAVIASLVRDILCFVPLVCLLPLGMGIEGVLWAAPISDLIAFAVTAVLTVAYWRKNSPRVYRNSHREFYHRNRM